MQNIMRPRWVGLAMYAVYLIAGIVFIVLPITDTVRESAGPLGQLAWHVFLVGGSLISLVGVWMRNSLIEGIGIPLIITSTLAYGLSIAFAAEGDLGSRLGLCFMFIGMSLGLLERIVETIRRLRIAVAMDKRGR